MSGTIQHIDEQRLDSDVGYRAEFLMKFIGFGADDVARIHDSASAIAPLVSGLVDAVYERLFSFDATKGHFAKKQHGFSGKAPSDIEELTLEHEHIAFRKQHLAQYFVKLVTAPYDGKMVQYLDWVGKIHTTKAGNVDLVVPIVQIDALFGFVSDALIAAIQGLSIEQARKDALVRSFTKLLWIQADLFVRHYVK